MARVNGFRIYVVKAFPNRRAGNEPFDVSAASWVRAEIFEILTHLAASGTQFVDPPPPVDEVEPRRPTRSITVRQPVTIRPDLFHVEVAIGEMGSHSEATRRGRKPRNLQNWSPEASHFVTFLFAEEKADQFLLISQSIRRRDPVLRLLALIKNESIRRRNEREQQDKESRIWLREQKQPVPKAKAFVRLAFDWKQAADNRYLSEILGKAKHASATFTSTAPSSRGSRADQVERTLTVRFLSDKNREIGRDIGRRWMSRRRHGDETSPSEGVSELAGLMEDNDLLQEGEGGVYDRVSVSLRDDEGESTTIAVDTLRDVFTYPVSDGAPAPLYYYERVAGRVKIVAQEERINVDDIDPGEVARCLGD